MVWSASEGVFDIERHDFSMAIGAEWDAIIKRIWSVGRLWNDVMALYSGVFPLMTQTALALTRNQRFKSNA
jgi:hypothetical protein